MFNFLKKLLNKKETDIPTQIVSPPNSTSKSYEHPFFEEAKQNHIKVSNMYFQKKIPHTSTKFRFLAQEVKRKSELYLEEATSTNTTDWKFKRGTLVFVQFGVNVGKELSGNHWAIILDNNDSPYKNTLTVVPLTSKNNHGRNIPIKEVITEQSIEIISKKLDALHIELYSYLKYLDNKHKLSDQLRSTFIQYDKKYKNLLPNLDIKALDTIRSNELFIEIQLLKELISYYKKYVKQSYAMCHNIQTISKNRIIKHNKMDPLGKLKVSNETLDIINEQIKKLIIVD